MKKIFLACATVLFGLGVNAQSDSTGNKMNNSGTIKNSDADPASRSRINSGQENKVDQNQDLNKTNTSPVQDARTKSDGHPMNDSAAMHKGQHINMSDTVHTVTPAPTRIKTTPVKPKAKAAVKPDKDKMYLLPDSTIKK